MRDAVTVAVADADGVTESDGELDSVSVRDGLKLSSGALEVDHVDDAVLLLDEDTVATADTVGVGAAVILGVMMMLWIL